MGGRTRYTRQYTVEVLPGMQRYDFKTGWRAKDIIARKSHFSSSNGNEYYAWGADACEIRKDEAGWFFWFSIAPIDYGTLIIDVKENP